MKLPKLALLGLLGLALASPIFARKDTTKYIMGSTTTTAPAGSPSSIVGDTTYERGQLTDAWGNDIIHRVIFASGAEEQTYVGIGGSVWTRVVPAGGYSGEELLGYKDPTSGGTPAYWYARGKYIGPMIQASQAGNNPNYVYTDTGGVRWYAVTSTVNPWANTNEAPYAGASLTFQGAGVNFGNPNF